MYVEVMYINETDIQNYKCYNLFSFKNMLIKIEITIKKYNLIVKNLFTYTF